MTPACPGPGAAAPRPGPPVPRRAALLILAGLCSAVSAAPPVHAAAPPAAGCALALVATDAEAAETGVAVAACAPGGTAETGWARAGAGAAAVLGRPDHSVALRALDLLSQGVPAPGTLEALLAESPARDLVQIALVGASVEAAAHSGQDAEPWHGHLSGRSYACLGRGVSAEKTILAMGVAFETTRGDLADRLLAALEAGQQAEAGRRPLRSAWVRVARAAGAAIDLRADDHDAPVRELRRLLAVLDASSLHRLGSRVIEQTRGEDVQRVQEMLRGLGYYAGEASGELDDASVEAVRAFRRDARLGDSPALDAAALEALRERYREWRSRQGATPTPPDPAGPVETEILPEALEPPAPRRPPDPGAPPSAPGR